MKNPWVYVDILKYFPQVLREGKIFVEIENSYLTHDAVVHRWTCHCNGSGDAQGTPKKRKENGNASGKDKRILILGRKKGKGSSARK